MVAHKEERNVINSSLLYFFFWKREALLILDNYIKMIQLYKIHPSLCITKMHTAYEKETKKRERHDLKIMAQQTTTSDFTFIRFANQSSSWTMK